MEPEFDFEAHNAEVKRVWEAYYKGQPYRVPVIFNINPRYYLFSDFCDPDWPKPSFKEYSLNPDVMMEVQLRFWKYLRFNVLQDQEMGLPDKWPGTVVDMQNYFEAAWFGCEIEYFDHAVPRFIPLFKDDKSKLFKAKLPEATGGAMARMIEWTEYFREKAKDYEFEGRPVGESPYSTLGTDGPFTVACNLRGATEVCLDMYTDPDYYHALMEFVTEGIIKRLKGLYDYAGIKYPAERWGFADDSIELLSVKDYMKFVYPYHRRLVEEFTTGEQPLFFHICGNVERFLPELVKVLNVGEFDLGFPVDLCRARKTLGPEITLRGNVHPELLRAGPPEAIAEAVKHLCTCGVGEGGRWILCEGNNVAPGTPPEHFATMYRTALEYGRY